jgi:hypothetical protein
MDTNTDVINDFFVRVYVKPVQPPYYIAPERTDERLAIEAVTSAVNLRLAAIEAAMNKRIAEIDAELALIRNERMAMIAERTARQSMPSGYCTPSRNCECWG